LPPGSDIKLTGPAVDREQVRAYLEKSLALAESFGAKVIVFGSPVSVEAESKDLAGDCGPARQFLERMAAPQSH
jgi:uncharacterized protein (DUF1330 family)